MARWEPDAEGRLIKAAFVLFDERGYDDTTVTDIAEAAGLTKRTFFRYFTDKREVLFQGSRELQDRWLEGIADAPPDAPPMAAVAAGLTGVLALFADRHPFARMRSRIIGANPELQERELIKLQTLAGAIQDALVDRGVPRSSAILAAQTGVTVFHVAFAHWIGQDDPSAFERLVEDTIAELRVVIAPARTVSRAGRAS
ncbi:TetR/AcrR family transcriptional regulator [Jatrophihabitans endophyticus]|uniref:TetR/AcrR family transcriptional regulator n=1 Tax=Jatrophihabitans endophyticus TaxID=1206085 RepID=UPI0019EC5EA8|nr:TetR/AcrR family transcriptional regulator [Jatrophihabitans endophyticus]MBE7187344.1 TetR/AcrR family transcriptional regulator [Jatrophihabitans endophyticus]